MAGQSEEREQAYRAIVATKIPSAAGRLLWTWSIACTPAPSMTGRRGDNTSEHHFKGSLIDARFEVGGIACDGVGIDGARGYAIRGAASEPGFVSFVRMRSRMRSVDGAAHALYSPASAEPMRPLARQAARCGGSLLRTYENSFFPNLTRFAKQIDYAGGKRPEFGSVALDPIRAEVRRLQQRCHIQRDAYFARDCGGTRDGVEPAVLSQWSDRLLARMERKRIGYKIATCTEEQHAIYSPERSDALAVPAGSHVIRYAGRLMIRKRFAR